MTRSGIERRSSGLLANTLTARPMSGTVNIKMFKLVLYFFAINNIS